MAKLQIFVHEPYSSLLFLHVSLHPQHERAPSPPVDSGGPRFGRRTTAATVPSDIVVGEDQAALVNMESIR